MQTDVMRRSRRLLLGLAVVALALTAGASTAQAAPSGVLGPSMTDNNDPGVWVDSYAPDGGSGYLQVGDVVSVDNGTWTSPPDSFSYQWQDCPTTGQSLNSCIDIAGATAASYTLQASDRGNRLRAEVTATDTSGSTTVWSVSNDAVEAPIVDPVDGPAITTNRTTQYVNGRMFIGSGDALSVSPGTWYGSPTLSYQWQDCNADNSSCTDISGATGPSYTVQASDLGSRLNAVITGTNSNGSGQSSVETGQAAGTPTLRQDSQLLPLSTDSTRPSWATEAIYVGPGDVLTAPTSGYDGPSLTYNLQWRDCPLNSPSSGSCTDIPGATGTSYTVQDSDLGFEIVATGTVTNSYGTALDAYEATLGAAYDTVGAPVPIAGQDPVVTTAGNPAYADAGDTLTVSDGGWYGDPTPTISYQWQDCDRATMHCTDIAGATSSSYTLTANDRGNFVYAKVIATSSSGSFPDQRAGLIDGAHHFLLDVGAPVNYDAPALSNSDANESASTAVPDDVLSVTSGSWYGSPTLAYKWESCQLVSPYACTTVGTAPSYTVGASDVGNYIRATITGTNAVASTNAQATTQVTVQAGRATPSVTTEPTLSGVDSLGGVATPLVGNVLSISNGSWSGQIDSFSYQWFRCDSPTDGTATQWTECQPIAGATDPSYTIGAADLGHSLDVGVYATNTSGTGEGGGFLKGVVGTPVPAADDGSLDGTTQVGETLTASSGSPWTPTPDSFTYSWWRCDGTVDNVQDCSEIGGATGASYTLVAADQGHIIQVDMHGVNSYGTGRWGLAYNTGPVTASASAAPVATVAPVMTATDFWSLSDGSQYPLSLVGNVLSVGNGTWDSQVDSYRYQWLRCESPTDGSATQWNSCQAISGATGSSYTLTDADRGHSVEAAVDATNGSGTGEADAVLHGIVGTPIPSADDGSITGTVQVGQTLTAHTGSPWKPVFDSAIYTWSRCASTSNVYTPVGCSTISGATGSTYTLTAADEGHVIQVEMRGVNGYGVGHALEYDSGGPVAAAPATSGSSGGSSSGSSSSSGTGSPTPSETPTTTPTAPAATASMAAAPGKTGSVAVQAPSGTQTAVSWEPTSFTAPVVVKLDAAPAAVTSGATFAAGTQVVTLTVSTSSGAAVTSFEAPLELTFPNAPASLVPAYSHDGTTWTAMPELASDNLPAGFHDGWFRDSDGTVHILTLHATYFGLLASTSRAQAELAAQVSVPHRISARVRGGLAVAIRPSLPGRLHLVLRGKGSRVVAEKVVQVKAGRDLVRLAWSKTRVPTGRYLLTLVLQAGRSTFVQRNVVTVSR